jgi:methionyl-tRNA synthetase
MALDLPLPRHILTHPHWTLGKRKMSKSEGNVVNPFFAIDRFGIDVLRFFLAYDGKQVDDSDYGNEKIIDRYNKSLKNSLGNLSSRVMRGKRWNVAKAVKFAFDDPVVCLPGEQLRNVEQRDMIKLWSHRAELNMQKHQVRLALHDIMHIIYRVGALAANQPSLDFERKG